MSKLNSLRGAVIMFDGPDYVGKTTQLHLASKSLEDAGLSVYQTRCNGGTPIGEALRSVLLRNYERPPISNLYINLAQHYALSASITAERKKGAVVLVDRSPLSIIAYQVHGDGLDPLKGYQAADDMMSLHKPTAIICYHAPEDKLNEWRLKAKHRSDYFESKPAAYFKRARRGYQESAKHYQAHVIDASGSINAVHQATMEVLSQLAAQRTEP